MKSILIIEDNTQLQQLYQEALTKLGYDQLTFATTAHQGLTWMIDHQPDLVVLDMMLPEGSNGFDVLEQMKKDPKLEMIPVVVVTNLDAEEKTARQIGAADYIVKTAVPFDQIIERIVVFLK